jgi:lipopolysaccharide assembly outer membrane protein LptD (OstA)
VTIGVSNRLYREGSAPGGASEVVADFVLQAGYDIDGSEFSRVYVDGRTYLLRGMTTRFNVGFDPEDANLDEALLEFGWADDRGDAVSLGYRFLRNTPEFFEAFPSQNDRYDAFRGEFSRVHQIDGRVRVAINAQWALLYRGAYSFERNLSLANSGGVEYISKCRCWAVGLELKDNRTRGPSVSFRYTLLGLGDDSRNPFEGPNYTGAQSFLQ